MIDAVKLSITPGSDLERRLKGYLKSQILALKTTLKEVHETRLVKWRKAYEAEPAEQTREFPFHNASNLVVPVVAIHSDTLLARVMSAVLKTNPLWVARVVGEVDGSEDWSPAMEQFLQYVGLEPLELDLVRVYHDWFGETIKYGTSTIKIPMVEDSEDFVVPSGDGTGNYEFLRQTTYSGPRPEKIPFNDFFIPPSSKTVEGAEFKAHRVRLTRTRLEERAFFKIYDVEAVNKIKDSPDRTSPDSVRQQGERGAGVTTTGAFGWAEWDIYECHFKFRVDATHYTKVIVWYHEKTDTILRAFFNYYPIEIFITARLFFRDEEFFGYGFCEMLSTFQEEISKMHNERRDNQTIANTKVWRVDPDSKLHKGYDVYPGAMIPAVQGEIEAMNQGELSQLAIEEERLAIELAEKRSGVAPPMQGAGAGTNTKRGIYSAMGTLSILQEGNTRTDLNVTDIRYAHTKSGRVVATEYAHFGIGDRAQMFGKLGDKLKAAFDAMRAGRLALPIHAATASVNREVEKQNDLLLTNVMARHYQQVSQMLTATENPQIPPGVKQFLYESVKSAEHLMKLVMKHFGYDEVDRLVPPTPPPTPQGGPGGPGMPPAGAAPQNQLPPAGGLIQ